jgi:hypothetical protein
MSRSGEHATQGGPYRRAEGERDRGPCALHGALGRQGALKGRAGTADSGPRVHLGDPKRAGDLVVGAAVDEAELERPALGLGKLGDRPLDRGEGDVVGRRLHVLVGVALDQPVAEWGGRLATRGEVRAHVHQDGVEPSPKVPISRLAEAVEREQRTKEGLLHRVLGIVGVAEAAAGGEQQGAVMGADDLLEGLTVAAPVRADEADRAGLLGARDIGRR